MTDITAMLLSLSPIALFFSIILLSYLLEDLAIITAAVAASQDVIPLSLAIIAVFIGIATGDILLYFLGCWARKWRLLRGFLLTKPSIKLIRTQLKRNTVSNLFIIRFIPGLRFLGFCLSGFFQIKFTFFLLSVFFATTLWTTVIFTLVYQLGEINWVHQNISWALIPIMLIILIAINRIARRKLKEKGICSDQN